MSALQTEAG